MAPAITHFLVGAALLLVIATPVVLRYDVDREHAIWLVPLGGVWGIAPDVHHIAPVFVDTLYAFHNSPWADLFGLHYTLDRQAVRARYYESVFGAIAAFIVAVLAFWGAGRVRRAGLVARRPLERAFVVWLATAVAAGIATLVLWVTVSVQAAFPTVAGLVGSSSVLVGGLLVIGFGAVMGVAWGFVLELGVTESLRSDPPSVGVGGVMIGAGAWVVGVAIGVPVVVGGSVPLVHVGSLAALVAYGGSFGVVYGLVRGAFSPTEPVRIGEQWFRE